MVGESRNRAVELEAYPREMKKSRFLMEGHFSPSSNNSNGDRNGTRNHDTPPITIVITITITMRVVVTIAALLLSAQALPGLSADAEERLESIEEMVHKILDNQAGPNSTITPSDATVTDSPSQGTVEPPSGLLAISNPTPVSDCLHRSEIVNPYRLFFYVPPTPYGDKAESKSKLIVSISTRWGIHYTKHLRKKIEKQTGLVAIKEPEWSICGWWRELDIKEAGVHRGEVDITRNFESDARMHPELKQELEHILRTTYPYFEIFLILLFTLPLLTLVMFLFLECLWRATKENRENFKAKRQLRKDTSVGLELQGVSSTAATGIRTVSWPPSYRSSLTDL